ncbi:hypothetical protein W97_05050 [Coniosporium apollinis CBS 100218]|uniref:Uncharacterized protein n=1 Tax=Coniosporium apollinis (strain CBS 100218) TaxID=1168221 RepID=R7YVW6_CONA1|nr:uncharacterized protein W97_05050 [Coniosporium apollinis CBS 100218]EON65811.1 hypothetical protein W97_05050 [Coniosporium apollinis CBS 100218]
MASYDPYNRAAMDLFEAQQLEASSSNSNIKTFQASSQEPKSEGREMVTTRERRASRALYVCPGKREQSLA